LLDFDGTSRAEAALDLANIDGHLELHRRQGLLAPARYLSAHMQVLAAAEELRGQPGTVPRLLGRPLAPRGDFTPARPLLPGPPLAERDDQVPQNVR
jgi:hypothetical protein